MDFIQYIGSIGGIGGVLAVLMWIMIRYLVSQMREDRKFMEDRLTKILADYNELVKERNRVMMRHAEVLTELITWLKTKNGSKL